MLAVALGKHWRSEGREAAVGLDQALREAADVVGGALGSIARAEGDAASLAPLFAEPAGEVVLAWCAASTRRRDVELARILALAAQAGSLEEARAAARSRVVEGPLLDALACAPLSVTGMISRRRRASRRGRGCKS